MITLPSPNTSLSSGTGSTLPSPLIQFENGAGLAFSGGLGLVSTSQSPLPISSVDLRERADLADVIAVIVADADVLDLLGLDVDLPQQIDQAHFRRHVGGGHGMAGIPQQVFVAVLDEIATVSEQKIDGPIEFRVG